MKTTRDSRWHTMCRHRVADDYEYRTAYLLDEDTVLLGIRRHCVGNWRLADGERRRSRDISSFTACHHWYYPRVFHCPCPPG